MRSLALRMTVSFTALAVITLAAAGWLTHTVLVRQLALVDRQALHAQLDAAAREVGLMVGYRPGSDLQWLPAEVRRAMPSVQITLLDDPVLPPGMHETAQMTIVDNSFPVQLMRTVVLSPGDELYRHVALLINGQTRAVWRITLEDPAATRIAALQQILLGSGALALVAAILMALWISRSLAAPLGRMAHAAGRLAEGDWQTPLPDQGPAEIRALSAAFQQMAARLARDFQQVRGDRERLKQLSAEVAHEIKTPIAALKTYHELLLGGEQENPRTRQELLQRGEVQVARLEYLAAFLVDMARLEAHTATLELREADLADLVRQAAAAVAPAAQQRGVAIDLDLPPAPIPVLANPQRLGQALDNLLQNALRVSPEGGAIRVRAGVENEAVVTVEDQGPGIPESLLPRLFEPFVRGEGSTGLGLGLAITRAILQVHGGSVRAENRPDGGARFILSLPLQS